MTKSLGNSFVYEGDFLISRSGTIGVVAIVDKNINGFSYGSFMIKFTLKEGNIIDKNYVSFYLNSKMMQELMERNKIGAIQGNITIDTIKNFPLPLPPLPHQQAIALHISELRSRAKALQAEAAAEIAAAKAQVEEMLLG